MTLMEVMVALMLLSMLSIALFGTFRYSQRSYVKITQKEIHDRDVLSAQRFLRGVIESAYPFIQSPGEKDVALEGSADEMRVTANSPGYSQAGYFRYRIFARRRGDKLQDVVVRYGIDHHGNQEVYSEGGSTLAGVNEEVLLRGISRIEFTYSEFSVEERASNAGGIGWASNWGNAKTPAAVKVNIKYPTEDSRYWPELIASPRVTTSALCEFDTVSQRCRGEQG